ncbi:MAG: helix-turn-helix domain-containing protein [Nanoarchaeota archaeon]|nr:helix-turn-helix domain-containing protein [Nanoarchaeota archaeon]
MGTKEVLKELGLSDGEVKVYLALLKLGETSVSKLTKETGQHRTTIYDFLEHLLQRGLVNYVVKSGVKYYKVADPDKLVEYLKEKEEKLKQILPELKQLAKVPTGEINVEVYSGVEGFKSVLNDRLKVGKDLYGFGVDEEIFEKKFPIVMKQFIKKEQEKKLQEFLLTKEKAKFIYKEKNMHYKYIPEEFFEPTATAVYGDRVIIIIWEPLTTILIKNRGLAESYRRYHKLLWKIAKKN